MRKHWIASPLALLIATTAAAQPQVDVSRLGLSPSAPRTQVLVLGTVHLSGAPKGFKGESLEPVIARLAAFKPQVITVEQISGEGCDLVARHPSVYAPEDIGTYCHDTAQGKQATGLDVPAAIAEVQRTLKQWPVAPTPVQRRHLAALFLAANDDTSAYVQWLQLPEAERHAGDGLDDALAKRLDEKAAKNNESYQIAARLAARLGLQRVYPIDDHTGDNVDVPDGAAYSKAVQHAWEGAAAKMEPINTMRDTLWQSGDMLALYRYINKPDVLRTTIESDFGVALRDPSPEHYGRIYVAGWETRNLRMAANIRATFREAPGTRVLTIVGSSHKPWLDSFIGQMQGVEIVGVQKALK
jgi:hypothetical protein